MFKLKSIPVELFSPAQAPLLTATLRGVERETLRVDQQGAMATSTHPKQLGSALTHPQITTDFSEALLEFITPPNHSTEELLAHLETLHQFTLSRLDNELLWPNSMPCALGQDDDIPVAQYGSSHNGRMKTTYRIGLGHRYGRTMQTVAGLHYNFSLPNSFWAYLSQQENSILDLQDFKNERYFALIRNFRRHYWLLIYLFGASPVMCRSFVRNQPHSLDVFNGDTHTLYRPYATSLRMGDLGYQSSAQEDLYVCYNQQSSYISSLCRAIVTPHPAYQDLGLKNSDGERIQLNTSLLQIENEFYSAIRPKRTAKPGETAIAALNNRGVEYIEVRCLDINPFDPLGISAEQIHFIDTFLLYCTLQGSPASNPEEAAMTLRNQKAVVNNGRQPGLNLENMEHGSLTLKDWGLALIDAMEPLAILLDSAHGSNNHCHSLVTQRNKLLDPALTPSAQLITQLQQSGQTFHQHTLQTAQKFTEQLNNKAISQASLAKMTAMVEKSLAEQAHLDNRASSESFDAFLTHYYAQYRFNDCS